MLVSPHLSNKIMLACTHMNHDDMEHVRRQTDFSHVLFYFSFVVSYTRACNKINGIKVVFRLTGY